MRVRRCGGRLCCPAALRLSVSCGTRLCGMMKMFRWFSAVRFPSAHCPVLFAPLLPPVCRRCQPQQVNILLARLCGCSAAPLYSDMSCPLLLPPLAVYSPPLPSQRLAQRQPDRLPPLFASRSSR